MRETVYLSMGSNLGDRAGNLQQARDLILQTPSTGMVVSGIYESAAWGFVSSHPFYNCCLSVSVSPSTDPLAFMEGLLNIELQMGRVRGRDGYTDRLIDIDLLLFGDRVLEFPGLKVPHPRMEERKFVLVPLAEIAAHRVHPVHGRSIRDLLETCPDRSEVRPVVPAPW
jgi:2-amino-4-hydroxy-6-hydroxymethyldihydropteridine diphosphokinase